VNLTDECLAIIVSLIIAYFNSHYENTKKLLVGSHVHVYYSVLDALAVKMFHKLHKMDCENILTLETIIYSARFVFLHYITLHCIALHFLDPELVKMTVGCGKCHINTKTYIQYN
jgi:hypothetical protein